MKLVDDPTNEMTVTWSTKDKPGKPVVYYGVTVPDKGVTGFSKHFVDGGKKKLSQYIHRVKLTGLQPGTAYGE